MGEWACRIYTELRSYSRLGKFCVKFKQISWVQDLAEALRGESAGKFPKCGISSVFPYRVNISRIRRFQGSTEFI